MIYVYFYESIFQDKSISQQFKSYWWYIFSIFDSNLVQNNFLILCEGSIYMKGYMDYRMDKTVYAADENKRFVMSNFTRSLCAQRK